MNENYFFMSWNRENLAEASHLIAIWLIGKILISNVYFTVIQKSVSQPQPHFSVQI